MRTKLLIGLVVLGLVAAGFSVLGLDVARAIPPHTLDGVVGSSVAIGFGNPANPASATYYLTSKPGEPVQVEQDIRDADGSTTAYFGKDVGSGWNWAAGDTAVVVIETIRGRNGWTGVNYTTSSDGTLTTANLDTFPAANPIESIPTLALVKYPGTVDVTWTGLTDTNQNVLNYTVYRAPNPAAAYVVIGYSTPQVAGGTVHFNNTGLAPNQYCYKIAVNYRRDTTGGIYTTTGTSEGACTTLGTAPTISSTSPVEGEVAVAQNAMVVVVFSEAMNPNTVTWTLAPGGGITFTPAWNPAFISLTLTHATAFAQCTRYSMRITGRDAGDDFPLVPGPVPNPWNFTTTCPSPQITVTSPVDGTTGVATNANIVVTFSKAMDTVTVTAATSPSVTLVKSWNTPTNTILTLTHSTAFTAGQRYMVTITGSDTSGNLLVSGGAPNPWNFTANTPPAVTLSSPVASLCWSGGSQHDIAWTVSDDATPSGSLVFTIRYTSSAGSGTIASGVGLSSPNRWTVPSIDATNVVVTVEATDGAGDTGSASSGQFQIDSTPPTVMSTMPAAGAPGVATGASIVITFSEGMTPAATASAVTITGGVTLTPSWNTPTNTILTLTHSTAFTPATSYTVTVGLGAIDDCQPGNALATPYQWQFTTGNPQPRPPTVSAAANSGTSVTLTITPPTTFTDGSPLASSLIRGYYIERAESVGGARSNLTSTPTASTSFTDTGVGAGKTYWYYVKTVLTDGRVSADSAPATVATPGQADLTWLWILLLIIIVVILIIALLAWRRRKPQAAPPRMPPAMEEPSTPMEEPTASEENLEEPGGGDEPL